MTPRTPPRATGPVRGRVVLPGSKSLTNRAVVCAALATGPSSLPGALVADDTEAMVAGLRMLGVDLAWRGAVLEIGSDGPRVDDVELDARQSGTTARFLLPLLALRPGPFVLGADEQMRGRPMGPSFDALRALGATITELGAPGHLPVRISGPVQGGDVEISGDLSSQFLSGLLLAAPLMPDGLRVTVTTDLISQPYVEMTAAVMRAFGARVEQEGDTWVVEPTRYVGTEYTIEPDASAASYFWAAGAMTRGEVVVPGLGTESVQGDTGFVHVLAAMGATVEQTADESTVGATATLHGVDVDMAHISDTVPTLAVVAALAQGPTTIRNVGFIRHKESDRIGDVVTELGRAGLGATERPDGLVVDGSGVPTPATIETYRDHRMAMAFALLGLDHDGIRIADPACVAKTVPEYWSILDDLVSGRSVAAR